MAAARSLPPLGRKVGICTLVAEIWGEEAPAMGLRGEGVLANPFFRNAERAHLVGHLPGGLT